MQIIIGSIPICIHSDVPCPQIINQDIFENYIDPQHVLTVQDCEDVIRNSSITLEQFDNLVTKHATLLVSKLYANTVLPRSLAQNIIEYVSHVYSITIEIIKRKYECEEPKRDVSFDIKDMCIVLQNAFANFKTEHQTLQFLVRRGYLIMPQSVGIGARFHPKRTKVHNSMDAVNINIQIIPMRPLLTKFLQLPHVFDTIVNYIRETENSEEFTSVLQGEIWKYLKGQFSGKIVLPLLLYFDDFEINNPLGSRSGINKIGVVYYTIPSIPNEYSSLLENIFLLQIHNTKYHLEFGNKTTFCDIISEIKDLETNGLIINVGDKEQKVYFAVIGIIGDNLGQHTIFGFSKSFNSTHSCRTCLVDKATLQKQTLQSSEMLRTRSNYDADCITKSHGIQEECVFNTIASFHVVENTCFDVMHDIFEGICRYEIAKLLNILINTDKLFSLNILNDRIRFFDYPITNNLTYY